MDKNVEEIIQQTLRINEKGGDWKVYLKEMVKERNERGEKSGSKL